MPNRHRQLHAPGKSGFCNVRSWQVWVPRGVPVCLEVLIAWSYIHLDPAIDPLTELLSWLWQANVPDAELQAWDRIQVVQPPYAPASNPVERFFQGLRRELEGRVYAWWSSRRRRRPSCSCDRPIRSECATCAAGPGSGKP